MAAHCEACGGSVMPYRRYAFWTRPTARCAQCGSAVRLRHFWTVVGMSLALLLPLLVLLMVFPSPVGAVAGALGLTAAALGLDYASYHVLTWELDPAFESDEDPIFLPRPEA